MEEISHIRKITGKEPKLRGFELLSYSPNINFQDASKACLTEIYENQNIGIDSTLIFVFCPIGKFSLCGGTPAKKVWGV